MRSPAAFPERSWTDGQAEQETLLNNCCFWNLLFIDWCSFQLWCLIEPGAFDSTRGRISPSRRTEKIWQPSFRYAFMCLRESFTNIGVNNVAFHKTINVSWKTRNTHLKFCKTSFCQKQHATDLHTFITSAVKKKSPCLIHCFCDVRAEVIYKTNNLFNLKGYREVGKS